MEPNEIERFNKKLEERNQQMEEEIKKMKDLLIEQKKENKFLIQELEMFKEWMVECKK